MNQTSDLLIHTCAKCGSQTEEQQAIANEYKCQQCDYELAHLDMATNGAVRGVFGWLKETQAVIGGRYQVETVLGKGGFGATYLVSDQRVNGKRWALKEIPEMLFDEYEVSLLSQLDHPSIPIIVDRFIDEGMVYLVLKFGGTKTLATECKQHKQIAYATLKPWILHIADVLDYLHNRNPPIIHRDLKPENILIDDASRVMLIDFGIAKESVAATVTRTLGRAASQGFSPPEQVMGTGTDVRSDIYSFAATLYFALVGTIPVPAHERVAGAVLQAPGELASGIPAEVDVMLMKALNLNINQRPQSIAEFLTAFTGMSNAENDALQSGKTVLISDIQFGPVINDTLGHSTPIGKPIPAADQQNNKARLVGIIASIFAIVIFSAGGIYWLLNIKTDDSADITPPLPVETATLSPTGTIQPIPTSQEPTLVPTGIPKNENIPSALDILNKRRENKQSVEANLVKDRPQSTKSSTKDKLKADAAEKEQAARIARVAERERQRRAAAKARAATQPAKTPNWGNQQQGNF